MIVTTVTCRCKGLSSPAVVRHNLVASLEQSESRYPEDGDDMFIRNICSSYYRQTAPFPGRILKFFPSFSSPLRTYQILWHFNLWCDNFSSIICHVSSCSKLKIEELRLLTYKNTVRTSQETHYVSATEPSR
jgi:hypothetical protein